MEMLFTLAVVTVIQMVLGWGLVGLGLFVMLVGSIGIIRLPDFYTRTHAASMVDTTGIIFLLLGLVVINGWELSSAKLLIGVAFIVLANPVAIHALARAALRAGHKPRLAEGPAAREAAAAKPEKREGETE